MRLLVIGGTSFIGRHTVEQAVAAGHEVTVFHRGRTNPDLLADKVRHRLGDRDSGDYASVDDRETWDAVIDITAYVPRHVHQLAAVLSGRCGHYAQVPRCRRMTRLMPRSTRIRRCTTIPRWRPRTRSRSTVR